MFVLLPDDPDNGLERLEGNMTTDNVKMLFSTLEVSLTSEMTETILVQLFYDFFARSG